jgi:hypothetical protein
MVMAAAHADTALGVNVQLQLDALALIAPINVKARYNDMSRDGGVRRVLERRSPGPSSSMGLRWRFAMTLEQKIARDS